MIDEVVADLGDAWIVAELNRFCGKSDLETTLGDLLKDARQWVTDIEKEYVAVQREVAGSKSQKEMADLYKTIQIQICCTCSNHQHFPLVTTPQSLHYSHHIIVDQQRCWSSWRVTCTESAVSIARTEHIRHKSAPRRSTGHASCVVTMSTARTPAPIIHRARLRCLWRQRPRRRSTSWDR